MEDAGSSMMEGVDLLSVVCVVRRVILVGIVGRVCGFASIVSRRATSELVFPFSYLVRCLTLHP